MQQFCYTSCRGGHSATGADGWQVRAVSDGISEQQARTYERLFRYGRRPADLANGTSAPAKLAFTTEPRRMLIHTVPAGQDPTTGRSGNYFAHVFVDPPDTFTALEAISTWDSLDWLTSDFLGDARMPQPSAMPRATLSPHDSLTYLKDATHKRWAIFCLQALLASDDGRLYVAGTPETLVRLIHIVALCLPISWRRCLSFSTYEGEPGNLKVRITGTTFPEPTKTDLPAYCYTNGRFGLNTYTGRQSPVSRSRYAERAVGILADHGGDAISAFVAVIDESDARSAGNLNVLAGALPIPDSTESLDAALAWPLSTSAKETVVAAAVKAERTLSAAALTHLHRHPSSLNRLLPDLLSSREYDRTVALLKSMYFGMTWAERILDRQDAIASHVMQKVMLDLLQNYGAADRALFCERNIDRMSSRPEVTPLLCSYIASLSPERAVTRSAAGCCRRIYGLRHRMSGSAVSHCRALLDIGRFLARPTVSTTTLSTLGRSVRYVSLDGPLGRRIAATLAGMISSSNWPVFASFIRSQHNGCFASSVLDRLCRRLLTSPQRDGREELLSRTIALVVEGIRDAPPRGVYAMAKDAVALDPALRLEVFRWLSEERPVHAFRFISQLLSRPHRLQLLVWVVQMNLRPRMEIMKCLIRAAREDLDRADCWRLLHDDLTSVLRLLQTPAAPATLPLWEVYVAQYPPDRCDDLAGARNLQMLRESRAPMQAEMNERLMALCSMSAFLHSPASNAPVLGSVGRAFARLNGMGSPILTKQLVHAILSVVETAEEAGRAIGNLDMPDPDVSAAIFVALVRAVIEEHRDARILALRSGLLPLILGTAAPGDIEKVVAAVPRRERVLLAQSIWTVLSRQERHILVRHSKDYAGDAKDMWNESTSTRRYGGLWKMVGFGRTRAATGETRRMP